MPIKDSLYFNYDGINSTEHKLINVNFNVGLFDEYFLPEQELYIKQVPGRDDPYYMGNKKHPLQIDLEFAFEEGFGADNEYIQNVSRWLFQEDYYKPLIFSNAQDKIYYCMYVGDPNLLHNCNKDGLIQISMRNIDPYIRSPFYESDIYTSVENITFDNLGDVELLPIIQLEILQDTDFTLINNTNETEMKFTGLLNGDVLEVDLRYQMINATNGENKIYRYDNLITDNLRIDVGENQLSVVEHANNWNMKLKYQYMFLK